MTTSQPTKSTGRSAAPKPSAAEGGFSPEERAAMQDRAAELKAAKRGSKASKQDGEKDLLAKIEAMDEPDRSLAHQVHALISATAPQLTPQTYYGMPAYAKDGKVLCFFKPGQKFKMRYSTLGFTDKAKLDDGDVWPSEFAVLRWSEDVAARIAALVRSAAA